MTEKKLSDRIQIDDANCIVTIDGCQYSGAALDFFTTQAAPGYWYRLSAVKYGTTLWQTKFEEPSA